MLCNFTAGLNRPCSHWNVKCYSRCSVVYLVTPAGGWVTVKMCRCECCRCEQKADREATAKLAVILTGGGPVRWFYNGRFLFLAEENSPLSDRTVSNLYKLHVTWCWARGHGRGVAGAWRSSKWADTAGFKKHLEKCLFFFVFYISETTGASPHWVFKIHIKPKLCIKCVLHKMCFA